MDSAIKGNVNGNHIKQYGKKWPWKNQQFKNKDQVFVGKNSILGIKNQSFRIKTQSFTADETKISNKRGKKNLRRIFIQDSIFQG